MIISFTFASFEVADQHVNSISGKAGHTEFHRWHDDVSAWMTADKNTQCAKYKPCW